MEDSTISSQKPLTREEALEQIDETGATTVIKVASSVEQYGTQLSKTMYDASDNFSGTLRRKAQMIRNADSSPQPQQSPIDVDNKIATGAVVASFSIQAIATVVRFLALMFNKCCTTSASYLSIVLYNSAGQVWRAPMMVATKRIISAVFLFLIYLINAIFDIVGDIVSAFSEIIVAKFEASMGLFVGNVVRHGIRIVIFLFQIIVASQLFGLKGVLLIYFLLFLMGVVALLDDPSSPRPPNEIKSPLFSSSLFAFFTAVPMRDLEK
ncbi:uncharacterized protein MONOS_6169 [Monocercomonoides exilis]|uniref:uncharacterized protein n=1 Tax=Monocercomonoides exilis TaxID=2049356 RepID=UPI00355A2456|nr:hypothetical protein MONOS_6169 [Monocercomonoides exilis]|eukprot:MONOS_6169.1-p1 / transcript=MONOS_6169.1 / gene=MONOS_6169 / organism=Monocercomonoides_exilis_PA203 / gene_product=unspecified product / transcript_product=unspecified product / location=Mono_scaffold00190:101351-102204(-) / protein_length=267 / sequence_SO=supercontig / SO=protein_coding / is_pseudo=false